MNDKTNVLILVAMAVVVLAGTSVMYSIESRAPNTHIKTFLDALWWCIATVTTVGYGDITPVTIVGRVVALIYMFFGIAMISLVLSIISNRFRKRIEKDESEDQEKEMLYLKDLVVSKLAEIERIQSQILELVNKSPSQGKN
jgi:voltage-gated potassium channel